MPLLAVLAQAAEEPQVNWLQVILAAALGVIIAWLAFRGLPPLLKRIVYKLDVWIPGDLSVLDKPTAFLGTAVVIGWVLFGAAVSIANGLGADTTQINADLLDFGAAVGTFAAEEFVQIAIIVGIAYVLVKATERAVPQIVSGVVKDRSRPDTPPGEIEKREVTLSAIIIGAVRVLVSLIVLFMILSGIGISVTPVLAAAGVVGIAVGFGAQSLVKDVLAGLFIILEDQYRVGDVVNVAGKGGVVEDINLRRTVIRDLEFVVHVVPNGSIDVVSNLTKEKSRMVIDIPVAYKEDLERCIEALNAIGEEMQQDDLWGSIITAKIAVLRVNNFADSAIDIRCLGQTLPIRQWEVAGEFRKRVKRRFDELGIEIPFPHQTVYWGVDQPPFHPPEGEKP